MQYTKRSERIAKLLCMGAWYCALFACAYSMHRYIGMVAEINKEYFLVGKVKKCSMYNVENNRLKVCPSRGSQK